MVVWEYLTFDIGYDRKKHKNWVVVRDNRPPLVGLQAILEEHGAQGWELVSLIPARFEAYPGFGQWTFEPVGYRATFKRPGSEL